MLALWEGFGQFSGNVVYFTSGPSGDDGGAGKRDALARLSPEFREVYAGGLRLHWLHRDFLLAESSLAGLADPDWGHSTGVERDRGWSPGLTPQVVWPAGGSRLGGRLRDRPGLDGCRRAAVPTFGAFETGPARHPTGPR